MISCCFSVVLVITELYHLFCSGMTKSPVEDGDTVTFISTLHGG